MKYVLSIHIYERSFVYDFFALFSHPIIKLLSVFFFFFGGLSDDFSGDIPDIPSFFGLDSQLIIRLLLADNLGFLKR